MTTIPDLTQIKIALVDPTGALLSAATGDLVTYSDLYAHNSNGVDATIRHAAALLAAYFAQQPTSVSSGGESVAWNIERAQFYDRLSKGQGGGTLRGTLRGFHVGGSSSPMFTRNALGNDPTLDEGSESSAA